MEEEIQEYKRMYISVENQEKMKNCTLGDYGILEVDSHSIDVMNYYILIFLN
jgi:hypothetical protein